MCGLVGMASSNILPQDKKMFDLLLHVDQIRGEHSTGVAAVDKDGKCEVYKKALAASDFMQLKGYSRVRLFADTLLLGHNRYATMGAKDDNNAHPFQHGTITLAHNGTLDNKYCVMGAADQTRFETDSETICYALDKFKEKDILENLEGAYALVWHDSADNTLHFARNNERPLYMGFIGNDLVWASERAMLILAAEHDKTTVRNIELLPVGHHRIYNLDALSEGYEKEEFTPKKAWTQRSSRGGSRGQTNSWDAVGTVIEGFLSEVRDSGFFEGFTLTGNRITGNISKDKVKNWQEGLAKDCMVRGKVTSSYPWYGSGRQQTCYHLSSKDLSIFFETEEVNPEKKCCICLQGIKDTEPAEIHGGDIYHTSCLDDLDWKQYYDKGAI